MKRYPVLYVLLAIIVSSCHFKKTHYDEMGGSLNSKLIGAYTGISGTDTVTLLILNVGSDSIEGWTIGLGDEYFKGAIKKDGDLCTTAIYARVFNENNAESAKFYMSYDSSYPNIINAVLKADADPSIKDAVYSLQRKSFTYSTSVGTYPQASERMLLDSDVNQMNKEDLEYMRNEIYARHGYYFKRADFQEMFDNNWYVPYSSDVSKDLTDIEKKNIKLIKKYEKTAKDEDFGRE